MENGLPYEEPAKSILGQIKILETSKIVGVVGVAKNKRYLQLAQNTVIKNSRYSVVDKDHEGVLWCWLPGEVPSEDKIVRPTLLPNGSKRYVNIISTPYIFAALQKPKCIRLFCNLDGKSLDTPPKDIYKLIPNFPNVTITDENIKWKWCNPNHQNLNQAALSGSGSISTPNKIRLPVVCTTTENTNGLKVIANSSTIPMVNGAPPKSYIFIDQIQSVEENIIYSLRHIFDNLPLM